MNQTNKDFKIVDRYFINLFNYIEKEGKENKDVIFGSMLNKIQKTSIAIKILLNNGLQSDARALLRNILEASIKLIVLSKDNNYYDLFINYHQQVRLDYCNHIINYKNIMKQEVLDEANSQLKAFDKKAIKDNSKEYNTYRNNKLAEIAGLAELYAYSYKIFCSDVHTDLISVKDNLKINGRYVKIDKEKKYENTNVYLETLLTILLKVVIDINKYYRIDVSGLKTEIKTNSNWVKSILNKP